jgi:ACR3 family arsenite efflux pump ArsB
MNQGINSGKNAVAGVEMGQYLAQSGMDATAQVVAIADTGTLINYNPVVMLTLKVTPAYGVPFDTAGQSMVSKIAIPRVGDTIKIKYNPANPTQLVVMQ